MDKKILLISGAALIAIIGLMWWGASVNKTAPVPAETGAASLLSASNTLYDFGTISMKNGLVDYAFTVTNPTAESIEIKKISTSCMCTTAFIESGNNYKGPFGMSGMGYLPPANETIGPGESRMVKVVYDPNAHGPAGVGSIDRLVYLTDALGRTLQLEIKAEVTP